jgi:TolB protein
MNRDGSNLSNITKQSSEDQMPYWAADNRIYFSTEIEGAYQIARMDGTGQNREILTSNDGDKLMPQLSADGRQILYYSDSSGNFEIYTLDVKSREVKQLTNDPLLDIRPRWSPDGRQIVFERGDKKKNQHIFIMNVDGSEPRQVTREGYNYAPSFVENCDHLCPR